MAINSHVLFSDDTMDKYIYSLHHNVQYLPMIFYTDLVKWLSISRFNLIRHKSVIGKIGIQLPECYWSNP